ncbi:zinc-binding alcohol dehydrogenase family protein [Kitasatospora sp. SolWspMP-SS2h]|uniref:zinc-binding dehydrogenase n=1 Tax=Kitasatospora sp. SolWspMP-SS2h TaxID=1305729 RepID=UPI000DBFA35F|nr:zinc-binding alcohol dehydrogenase family protein [Kitasatospora sp. SolWspMP-SS2h]
MRTAGFRVNGGVEVLEELDAPEPVPAAGQVTVRVAFAGVDLAHRSPHPIGGHLTGALRLLATGRIEPGITEALPPAEAAEAHRLLETGTGKGKLLLALHYPRPPRPATEEAPGHRPGASHRSGHPDEPSGR